MTPATIALRPRAGIRNRWMLITAILALSFASLSCGTSEPKTEVLGVVEVVDAKDQPSEEAVDVTDPPSQVEVVEVTDPQIEVQLIEPLCITNTPTHEPC